jgi:hypothetical protein
MFINLKLYGKQVQLISPPVYLIVMISKTKFFVKVMSPTGLVQVISSLTFFECKQFLETIPKYG